MTSKALPIGVAFLGAACAHQQRPRQVFQDCSNGGYCTDVQYRPTASALPASEAEWPSYGRTPFG
ncbi:MAG TPA: hypothetical protein VHT23_00330, partial [Gemmatimonadaceae bacterium]|nr:hypothetical protein [Gemmatimonadaceae bacterium]